MQGLAPCRSPLIQGLRARQATFLRSTATVQATTQQLLGNSAGSRPAPRAEPLSPTSTEPCRCSRSAPRYQAGRFGNGFKPHPKSDAGIRPVPLAPLVVEAIRRRLPPGNDPDDLV